MVRGVNQLVVEVISILCDRGEVFQGKRVKIEVIFFFLLRMLRCKVESNVYFYIYFNGGLYLFRSLFL